MSKQYEIATLKDIFDNVPADRIELCMSEIARGMKQAKATYELVAAVAKDSGFDGDIGEVRWPDSVTWIDDDKGEIGARFVSESGADLFTVVTKPAEQP